MRIITFLFIFIAVYYNPVNLQQTNLPNDCGRFEGKSENQIGTTVQEFPWIVSLLYYNAKTKEETTHHVCGGVLISNRYVLTAGHCVIGDIQNIYGYVRKVRFGVWDLVDDVIQNKNKVVDIPVEENIVISGFLNNGKPHRVDNIALLRLRENVNFNDYIKPICVSNHMFGVNDDDNVTLSGWGVYYPRNNMINKVKLKLPMKIYNQQKCAGEYFNLFKIYVTNKHLCAKGVDGSSCFGVGGEPIMSYNNELRRWFLQGIVSHGPASNLCDKVSDVYTRVSEYYDWIRNSIRP